MFMKQERYFHVMLYLLAKYHYLIPLLLEILDNMCIAIICFPICAVIKSLINHSFLIKKSQQKYKYLKNGKSL